MADEEVIGLAVIRFVRVDGTRTELMEIKEQPGALLAMSGRRLRRRQCSWRPDSGALLAHARRQLGARRRFRACWYLMTPSRHMKQRTT